MEGLIQNLTTALGWSIVHSLWQGAALYLIVFGTYLLLPKLKANWKYMLAMLGQATLFVFFAGTFIHYFQWPQTSVPRTEAVSEDLWLYYVQLVHESAPNLEAIFPYMVLAYGLGILLQFVVLTKSYVDLRSLRRNADTRIPANWRTLFTKSLTALNLQKSIGLRLSDSVSVPMMVGFFKPLLLFPLAYVNAMKMEHVEALILHELAHIKRNDYIFNMLKVFFETILFFNPFTWLMSRHIDSYREDACDHIVVQHIESPTAYAQALLEVELFRTVQSPSLVMTSNPDNYKLLTRIKKITNMETKFPNVKQQLFAILLSSLAFVGIAWISPQQEDVTAVSGAKQEVITKEIIRSATTENRVDTVENDLNTETDATSVSSDTNSTRRNADTVIRIQQEINDLASSPEIQKRIAQITIDSKSLTDKTNSPEFKKLIEDIEKGAMHIEKLVNSPEFKKRIDNIEIAGRRVEKVFESEAWKENVARIEVNGKRIEAYFNSPEWKDKVAKIEEQGKKIELYFDSPEWKQKIKKIEESVEKSTEFYNSPEYKELQKKHNEELQRLKAEKGVI